MELTTTAWRKALNEGVVSGSHWLWGGYLTQHAASIFWATLYSWIYGHRDDAKRLPQALAGAIATTAVAGLVDYQLIPKRLTPGYEHRVSTGAMVATFAALAAGFALGAVALQKRS